MTHYEKSFIDAFNGIAKHKHRYKVFEDFVTLSAIAIHNGIRKSESLENEYLSIIAKYSKDEAKSFAQLLGELVNLLEARPKDVIGQLYMSLELGNSNSGQFFSPDSISRMMAQFVTGEKIEIPECGFLTMSEPACGAGGMVLAYVDQMIQQKLNPAYNLWVQCIDIDRTVALMCYIQLSLWNVPAQIIVGNSLSLEFREQFFTPAHYLFNWDYKLRKQKKELAEEKEKVTSEETKIKPETSESPSTPMTKIIEVDEIVQIDMFGNL